MVQNTTKTWYRTLGIHGTEHYEYTVPKYYEYMVPKHYENMVNGTKVLPIFSLRILHSMTIYPMKLSHFILTPTLTVALTNYQYPESNPNSVVAVKCLY